MDTPLKGYTVLHSRETIDDMRENLKSFKTSDLLERYNSLHAEVRHGSNLPSDIALTKAIGLFGEELKNRKAIP